MKLNKTIVLVLLFLNLSFNFVNCEINNSNTIESVLERLEQEDTQFVMFTFVNLTGILKEVIVPIDKVKSALEYGLTFDSSSIPGYSNITESDMILKADLDSLKFLPWTCDVHKTAWFMCNVYKNLEEPYEADPRFILQKILKELEDLGLEFNIGTELEFFIFKKPDLIDNKLETIDKNKYFDTENAYSRQQENHVIIHTLKNLGIDVEKLHHEVASGQHEFSLKYNNALKIADQIIAAKYALKVLADQLGYKVSFMPKPIFGQNGSGMHVHYSLYNTRENKNAFYSANNKYGLSDIAQKFLAGNLNYIKEFSAILNPTINSYKRLVPDFEAPVYNCWGRKNRSSMFRLPLLHENPEISTRIEIRNPDPSCNPYLAFAAILKTGLAGIKENKILVEPVTENLFKISKEKLRELNIDFLPSSLSIALNYLEKSTFAKELLSEKGLTEYIKIKNQECYSFNIAVTDWEINNYI